MAYMLHIVTLGLARGIIWNDEWTMHAMQAN